MKPIFQINSLLIKQLSTVAIFKGHFCTVKSFHFNFIENHPGSLTGTFFRPFSVWHPFPGIFLWFFNSACPSAGRFLIYSIHFTSTNIFSSEMSPSYLWWLGLLIYSFNFLAQMLREIYIFYLKMYFIHLDKNSFPYLP